MNQLKTKKSVFSLSFVALMAFCLMNSTVNAQTKEEGSSLKDLEEIKDKNMDYMKQIHKIIRNYPAFSYMYEIDDGRLQDVEVTGVDKTIDKKKLEVHLFDLKSNRNMIKNQANRIGVFYSIDEEAEYKGGRDALEDDLMRNLDYPEDAKDWGAEGTIFVQFVVDENGEIPFATTTSDVETSMESYVNDLEQQAVEAVKATSGKWKAGQVEDVNVASLLVVPITFDLRTDPSLAARIR